MGMHKMLPAHLAQFRELVWVHCSPIVIVASVRAFGVLLATIGSQDEQIPRAFQSSCVII